MFKLAMIQMRVEDAARELNLRRARELIRTAAKNGAQVALLPEVLDVGWNCERAKELAEPIPDGSGFGELALAARETGLFLCAGLTERCGSKVYNAAVLLNPKGELLLVHRKLNELEIGHACYDQGDRLGVAETSLGTIGVMICADGFVRERSISQSLGYMGAQIILSPCAWAVPSDHDNGATPYGETWRNAYTPPARDFKMWIAGVSNVGWVAGGAWKGWKCIGCSLAVDDAGREVVQGPYGAEAETILYLDVALQPRPARGDGWQQYWKSAPASRPDQ